MTRPTYISGPMTGYPLLNFPAFEDAARRLRALGVEVVNPAELNPDPGAEWVDCMRVDIKALCDCGSIAMLRGWQASRGARLEHQIATALGFDVWDVDALIAAKTPRNVRAGGR